MAREDTPLDQEVFDRVLKEQLDAGTDKRVAEGRARSAAVRAYKAAHPEEETAAAPAAAAAGDGGPGAGRRGSWPRPPPRPRAGRDGRRRAGERADANGAAPHREHPDAEEGRPDKHGSSRSCRRRGSSASSASRATA